MTKVLNTRRVFCVVPIIIISKNKKDSINLQPHGRVDLDADHKVDPSFDAAGNGIVIHEV